MNTVLERVERTDGRMAFDGECAFCGIATVESPTWVFCNDCDRTHGVCAACAQADVDAETTA